MRMPGLPSCNCTSNHIGNFQVCNIILAGETVSWLCRESPSKIAVKEVINKTISGLDGNQLRIRIYHPANAVSRKPGLPILIFCHGGGFFVGCLDTHDDLCRNLASISKYIVLSVDYR